MKRFQQLIKQARGDVPAWAIAPLADAQLHAVARLLDENDVTEVLDWLDYLAAEKANLPEWDGDSAVDIADAQHELARLLTAAPAAQQALTDDALATRSDDTRQWLKIAMGGAG